MLSLEPQTRPALLSRIEIGRVGILLASGTVTQTDFVGEATGKGRELPYLIAFPTRFGLRYRRQGRSERLAEGEYVLLGRKSSFELEAERGGAAAIVSLPAADLKARIASVEDHAERRFAPNAHMSRLLVDFLRGVAELFAGGHPPNPEALATEIVSIVALALAAEDRGGAIDVRNGRYHLRRRIFEFIESKLGDQDLCPKMIAASSRISVSYLYSLFNDDDTTVGQFVQTKRLQRAYEMLVADPSGRRTVSEVAYEVGFKNVSHFSRSFSRHFKMAPRDVRQTARPSDERDARERRALIEPLRAYRIEDATGALAHG